MFLENAARNNSEIHKLSDEYKSRTVKMASELSKTKQESAMQVRHMLADCIKSKRINSITAKLGFLAFVPVISNSSPSLDLKGQYDYDFFSLYPFSTSGCEQKSLHNNIILVLSLAYKTCFSANPG